ERSTHPLLEATPDRGRTRWILILCAWTIVGLLFTVQEIAVAKVHGGHVSLVVVGVIGLVYWEGWAGVTYLFVAFAERGLLTGPRFVPHTAIHTIASFLMASLASVTEYFLSRGLLGLLFRITDPGAPRPLPTFTGSVVSMSLTGVITYWLVVGLYQSIQFY